MLHVRSLALALSITAMSAGAALAQAKREPIGPKRQVAELAPSTDDRATLLRLEDGWAAALPKRDRAYFEAALDPAFIYTEDDRLSTRAQVMADLVGGSEVVTSAHNEDMKVHLFGSSTAVVTGLLAIDGKSGKTVYHHRYRFTDTWVRQPDGKWKIVAAQDYLIPRKGA